MTRFLLLAVTLVTLMSCKTPFPRARVVPHELTAHGHTRVDEYYWLKNRDDPEVIAYLEAENAYYERVMAEVAPFEDRLFDEIVARIKKDDDTVPVRYRGYYHYVRFEKGKEYAIHCRKRGSVDAPEEIILDENELAAGHEFFRARGVETNTGAQNILAYAVDTVGRRLYDIHFKNLETGETLEETIPEVTGNLAWAEDGKTLFYSKQDPETLRSYRVYRHELGTDPRADMLVYEEKDDTFSVYVWKPMSDRYVMITSSQTLSTEVRLIPADQPSAEPVVFLPREREHEYSIDHLGDTFWVRTNWQAKNFRLMKTTDPPAGKSAWEEVIGHRDDVLLEGFDVFNGHLVVSERTGGLLEMRIRSLADGAEHTVDFGEPAYLAWPSGNAAPDTTVVRYYYTSMTTPGSVYDYDMNSRTKTLRKRQEVLGDFDAARYFTERVEAPARDGRRVPISLVYKKGMEKGHQPLLLYGYGSYGATMDATFNSARLSLLDRGFVYAIAHVRGGEELGRWWYEEGKLLNKKNTFTDFIDCAEFLVREGYADPRRVYANGGSAGGLLMGAVVNMRPELFHGVVADVPWVDVVTTMLDDSIPLTTSEYDEWGDPNDEELYDYMLSYSPYDNVGALAYPNLLVTTSLHDSQVQYWEPAKWVAKLRAHTTSDNLILLKTDLAAGHGGKSGRLEQHRDTATRYAFLLTLAGLAQ